MREDEKIWARFAHPESLRWGGDPGEQLCTVPAALRLLGREWRLLEVELVGASTVARMRRQRSDGGEREDFLLTFDYVDGSPTEGTWGFRYGNSLGLARAQAGFEQPSNAVAAFLRASR
ncbi:MAG: hypothetical protein KF710_00255 [Rhodocyclaceae bacterium]|nr:hypothetical protein [Rhodocyclaceae bacterium]